MASDDSYEDDFEEGYDDDFNSETEEGTTAKSPNQALQSFAAAPPGSVAAAGQQPHDTPTHTGAVQAPASPQKPQQAARSTPTAMLIAATAARTHAPTSLSPDIVTAVTASAPQPASSTGLATHVPPATAAAKGHARNAAPATVAAASQDISVGVTNGSRPSPSSSAHSAGSTLAAGVGTRFGPEIGAGPELVARPAAKAAAGTAPAGAKQSSQLAAGSAKVGAAKGVVTAVVPGPEAAAAIAGTSSGGGKGQAPATRPVPGPGAADAGAAAAPGAAAPAPAPPPFDPVSNAGVKADRGYPTSAAASAGHAQLTWAPLLAGRRVVALSYAPEPDAAAAAVWYGSNSSHLGVGASPRSTSIGISSSRGSTTSSTGSSSSSSDGRISRHLICCAYSPMAMAATQQLRDHSVRSMGCLCVWDLAAPHQPVAVMLSEGTPTCCTWGAASCAGACFAVVTCQFLAAHVLLPHALCTAIPGMAEGSVCAWDLAEPASAHQPLPAQQLQAHPIQHQHLHQTPPPQQQQQQQQGLQPQPHAASWASIAARTPSYSTDCAPLAGGAASCAPLVALAAVARQGAPERLGTWDVEAEEEEKGGAAAGQARPAGEAAVASAAAPAAAGGAAGGAAAGGGRQQQRLDLQCQVVSLAQDGTISVFCALLLEQESCAAASLEYGMRTGSRLRLVRTIDGVLPGPGAAPSLYSWHPHHFFHRQHTSGHQQLHQEQLPLQAAAPIVAHSLQLLPGDAQQLLVGAGGSRLLRGACLGCPSAPREYYPAEYRPALRQLRVNGAALMAAGSTNDSSAHSSSSSSGIEGSAGLKGPCCASTGRYLVPAAPVVSLHVSHFCEEAVLAAHSSGSVVLHSTQRSHAVMVWHELGSAALVAARWSPKRPCVFMVLDAAGGLTLFDLAVNTAAPVAVVSPPPGSTAHALSMEVEAPSAWSNLQSSAGPALPDCPGTYTLGFSDGHAECHLLPNSLDVPLSNEVKLLYQMIA